MQGGPNDVDRLSVRDFFDYKAGGAFRRHTTQKLGDRIQAKEPPIDSLDPAFWLSAYTGEFERWGCLGLQLLCPLLMILLAAKLVSSFATRFRCLKTIFLAIFYPLLNFFELFSFYNEISMQNQSSYKPSSVGAPVKMRGRKGAQSGGLSYSCALSHGSHLGGVT